MSQSFAAYTESINQGRTSVKRQLSKYIARLKKIRDDTLQQASLAQDKFDSEQNLFV